MPYELKHVKGGFQVVNKDTGKKFSHKPIPEARAERQLRLLRMLQHMERRR